MDAHYQQYKSWSGWDAVRHWMYEDIYATLEKNKLPENISYLEVGVGGTDSPIGRMMMQLQELKNFGLEMRAGDYPQYDITNLHQIGDATVSMFVADQVLEHVTKPWEAIREVDRVLTPGGIVVFASPFMFPLHYCPLDCWRIAPNGYSNLFPPEDYEMLTLKTWGTRKIVAWGNTSDDLKGYSGNWISVDSARRDMPDFNDPHYNEDYPIVVWFIGRKK